ncbi:Glycosyltransferase 39 [Gracilaria domingensis]|nr:Glycosyltransferase 39 [Gracilaria domingensis]
MIACKYIIALSLTLFYSSICVADTEVADVTYGSTIKLEHAPTKYRLHSHDIKYGTGSEQQSVTAVSDKSDSNSFWIVRSAHGSDFIPSGTAVKCGETFRLQHLNTGKNLHSHKHQAPLNRDYEVSAYGELKGRWAEGDTGDNWVLQCVSRSESWKRGAQVRLHHVDTGYYLSTNSGLKYTQVIAGQQQVSASNRKNQNTVWSTSEGFYIAPQHGK